MPDFKSVFKQEELRDTKLLEWVSSIDLDLMNQLNAVLMKAAAELPKSTLGQASDSPQTLAEYVHANNKEGFTKEVREEAEAAMDQFIATVWTEVNKPQYHKLLKRFPISQDEEFSRLAQSAYFRALKEIFENAVKLDTRDANVVKATMQTQDTSKINETTEQLQKLREERDRLREVEKTRKEQVLKKQGFEGDVNSFNEQKRQCAAALARLDEKYNEDTEGQRHELGTIEANIEKLAEQQDQLIEKRDTALDELSDVADNIYALEYQVRFAQVLQEKINTMDPEALSKWVQSEKARVQENHEKTNNWQPEELEQACNVLKNQVRRYEEQKDAISDITMDKLKTYSALVEKDDTLTTERLMLRTLYKAHKDNKGKVPFEKLPENINKISFEEFKNQATTLQAEQIELKKEIKAKYAQMTTSEDVVAELPNSVQRKLNKGVEVTLELKRLGNLGKTIDIYQRKLYEVFDESKMRMTLELLGQVESGAVDVNILETLKLQLNSFVELYNETQTKVVALNDAINSSEQKIIQQSEYAELIKKHDEMNNIQQAIIKDVFVIGVKEQLDSLDGDIFSLSKKAEESALTSTNATFDSMQSLHEAQQLVPHFLLELYNGVFFVDIDDSKSLLNYYNVDVRNADKITSDINFINQAKTKEGRKHARKLLGQLESIKKRHYDNIDTFVLELHSEGVKLIVKDLHDQIKEYEKTKQKLPKHIDKKVIEQAEQRFDLQTYRESLKKFEILQQEKEMQEAKSDSAAHKATDIVQLQAKHAWDRVRSILPMADGKDSAQIGTSSPAQKSPPPSPRSKEPNSSQIDIPECKCLNQEKVKKLVLRAGDVKEQAIEYCKAVNELVDKFAVAKLDSLETTDKDTISTMLTDLNTILDTVKISKKNMLDADVGITVDMLNVIDLNPYYELAERLTKKMKESSEQSRRSVFAGKPSASSKKTVSTSLLNLDEKKVNKFLNQFSKNPQKDVALLLLGNLNDLVAKVPKETIVEYLTHKEHKAEYDVFEECMANINECLNALKKAGGKEKDIKIITDSMDLHHYFKLLKKAQDHGLRKNMHFLKNADLNINTADTQVLEKVCKQSLVDKGKGLTGRR